jgi:DNA-binding MarR family transcriptional regulator
VLSLTISGRKLLTRATRMAARMEAELFGHISEEERARFEALVQRIAADPRRAPTD